MMYQKENSLVLTGNNAIITNPDYVITLCFQIEDGSRRGKTCDISITKNQLEMLHKSLATWLECMIETPTKEKAKDKIEPQKIMENIKSEKYKLINPENTVNSIIFIPSI